MVNLVRRLDMNLLHVLKTEPGDPPNPDGVALGVRRSLEQRQR